LSILSGKFKPFCRFYSISPFKENESMEQCFIEGSGLEDVDLYGKLGKQLVKVPM
jgi:hypothetical protein